MADAPRFGIDYHIEARRSLALDVPQLRPRRGRRAADREDGRMLPQGASADRRLTCAMSGNHKHATERITCALQPIGDTPAGRSSASAPTRASIRTGDGGALCSSILRRIGRIQRQRFRALSADRSAGPPVSRTGRLEAAANRAIEIGARHLRFGQIHSRQPSRSAPRAKAPARRDGYSSSLPFRHLARPRYYNRWPRRISCSSDRQPSPDQLSSPNCACSRCDARRSPRSRSGRVELTASRSST